MSSGLMKLSSLLIGVCLSSCTSSEVAFRSTQSLSIEPPASANSDDLAAQGAIEPELRENWISVATNTSAASFESERVESQDKFQETFWFGGGATTALADYLFVIDDSVSMENIIELFHAGFDALNDSDAFPQNARIAVMNMSPGSPTNLRRRHRVVPFRIHADRSPGFLSLIDAAGIKHYNTFLVDNGENPLAYDGCSAWFSPKAKNAQGVPCLLAHTQLSLHRSVAESGLVSFRQLVEKSRRGGLFREGAAVNVVFVSDTHDPGFGPAEPESFMEEAFDELVALQPSFEEMKVEVAHRHLVSSFRVHAIAPKSECSEPWMQDLDPVYFDVATAGGGVIADVCTTTDYSGLIREIGRLGSEIQVGVFPLAQGVGALEIDEVLVGGESVPWTLSSSGRSVVVGGEMSGAKETIRIRYSQKTSPSVKRPAVQGSRLSRQPR